MKLITLCAISLFMCCLVLPRVFAQGAGNEWEALFDESMESYRAGEYDRAVAVAKKALEMAEENVGPNHPDVAKSLKSLAMLYQATQREEEAANLEQRAAAIQALKH